MGSATAHHSAKAGARVLLLEQFQHGHQRGSAHGETRIIQPNHHRSCYPPLVQAAYTEWRALERLARRRLLFIGGGISLAPPAHPRLTAMWDNLREAGFAVEWWNTAQLGQRFPQFCLSADTGILWQKDCGVLHAAACLAAHLYFAEQYGAEIRVATPVTRLDWQGERVAVHIAGEVLQARKVVVTAGAWTGQLLAELDLPLTVTRQQVVYYQPAAQASFSVPSFPVFTEITAEDEVYYGVPFFGAKGLKLARHGGGATVSPDTCDRAPDKAYITRLDHHMRALLPACGEVADAEVCLYTETPDQDFIIDHHPHCPQVLIAAGFSGRGFKFSALIGRILSELVLHDETAFDLSPFRIGRL